MGESKTIKIPVSKVSFESADDSQFLRTKFYAISEGDNRNRSNFSIEGMLECKNTDDCGNKPILGSWNKEKANEYGIGDFGGHDSDIEIDNFNGEYYNTYLSGESERPLGVILPNTAKIEIYKYKQWLSFEGLIWSKYNHEAVSMLKKKKNNNVSVEIEVIDSYIDDRGIEIITKFTLLGITVIGVETGIKDACLDVISFSKTAQYNSFVRAFSNAQGVGDVQEMSNFAKENGSGDALTLDLTKESASNDKWGSVQKTKLRNDLLLAKNYKSLISKSYLVAEEGWEDSPSSKLKYPIVQIKDGKVVLNINGVQAASSFLMKEKNEPYFSKAKAKLNKIRKMLGMDKVFGIEWNDDWGEIVAEREPHIIKMEEGTKLKNKEYKDKLCSLFADKEVKDAEYATLKEAYESKMGAYEYAEDDKKEDSEKEMSESKVAMEKAKEEVFACEKAIMEMAKCMADDDTEDDDEKEKIDDEEEEYPEDTEDKDDYMKVMAEHGMDYVSNSKSYILGEKEGSMFACKYEKTDKKINLVGEPIKADNVYAIFKTEGSLSVADTLDYPKVKVEFARGISSVYASNKADKTKINKMESDSKDYKENISTSINKFEEIVLNEDTTAEYKNEVRSKIFACEYSSVDDMEVKVKAKLYEDSKGKPLSGKFSNDSNPQKTFKSKEDEIAAIVKQYEK